MGMGVTTYLPPAYTAYHQARAQRSFTLWLATARPCAFFSHWPLSASSYLRSSRSASTSCPEGRRAVGGLIGQHKCMATAKSTKRLHILVQLAQRFHHLQAGSARVAEVSKTAGSACLCLHSTPSMQSTQHTPRTCALPMRRQRSFSTQCTPSTPSMPTATHMLVADAAAALLVIVTLAGRGTTGWNVFALICQGLPASGRMQLCTAEHSAQHVGVALQTARLAAAPATAFANHAPN